MGEVELLALYWTVSGPAEVHVGREWSLFDWRDRCANAAKFGARYLLNPPRPPHWGGFRLVPDSWEFWQGRKSRLHDRLHYRQEGDTWVRERLAP
jgi:pyridoxine/pyridoxamine 5'-phosphate oxidase